MALDVYYGGWQEVDRVSGNVDAENVWHHRTINLDNYLHDDFKIRFRAKVSHSNEDGNVDNVKIVGTPAGPPEITISDAIATEGSMGWSFAESIESDTQAVPYHTWDVKRSDAGDYYATTVRDGDVSGIMRIDGETGEIDPEFVPLGTAGLGKAREITIQGDWLYVANKTTDEVLRFELATGDPDPAGAFVSSGDHGLTTPRGITFDNDGNLLVVSKGTNEIQKYDLHGDFLGVFASGITSTIAPNDLTIDAAGDVYVTGDAKVYRYASDGTFLGVFADGGSANTTSIEFGPDGHLYVADGADGNVLRFDGQTGSLIDVVIGSSFGQKQGMAFDGAGSLLVANHPGNTYSARVLRYASSSAAAFTVELSSPSAVPITVDYTTSDDTATAGSDYVATSGTLVFEPGVTSRTIIVPTLNDSVAEPTETFFVNLANPTGAAIADSLGLGTILDDDPASQPPTASDDAYSVVEDTDLTVLASGVLNNDTDPENEPLTAVLVTSTSHGSLTLNSDGSFACFPDVDYFAPDSFTYRANDGTSDSYVATVSIEVTPVNDAPVAVADSYAIDQDTVLSVPATGVLANDSDVDGDALTAVSSSGDCGPDLKRGGAFVPPLHTLSTHQ